MATLHAFTAEIMNVLQNHFKTSADEVYRNSYLLQYLNHKTRSASRDSKSRSSFGNVYAVFVLVEDYIGKGYVDLDDYKDYAGAKYSDLFTRQRQLPFGNKLQNHPLNHRMNEEFRKFFPTVDYIPIMRNAETKRYWINENLLKVTAAGKTVNIAPAIIDIINAYIGAKRTAFNAFIETCQRMKSIQQEQPKEVEAFIDGLVKPNVDARVFEIVSYAILKEFYAGQVIYWGFSLEEIQEDSLTLYKTGRTNANDGGIDFVMKPLGRFFQVTETTDVRKYFLDIDKVQRFPITFVVKSAYSEAALRKAMSEQAQATYGVAKIVERYMSCVEEIINIPVLLERFASVVKAGRLEAVMKEIIIQSEVEFNYEEGADEEAEVEAAIEAEDESETDEAPQLF